MGWGNRGVEATSDALTLVTAPSVVLVVALILLTMVWAFVGSLLDFAEHRLPNWWLWQGFVLLSLWVGLKAAVLSDDVSIGETLAGVCIGGAVWFSSYFLPFVFFSGAIGAGDVKLAAILGGAVGVLASRPINSAWYSAIAIVLAAVFTVSFSLLGTWRWVLRGEKATDCESRRKAHVAHGPGMLCAVWCLSVFIMVS